MRRFALSLGCCFFSVPVAAAEAVARSDQERLRSAIELVLSGVCAESEWSYSDPEVASAILNGDLPLLKLEHDSTEDHEATRFLFAGPDPESLYSLEVETEGGRCTHYSIGLIIRCQGAGPAALPNPVFKPTGQPLLSQSIGSRVRGSPLRP